MHPGPTPVPRKKLKNTEKLITVAIVGLIINSLISIFLLLANAGII